VYARPAARGIVTPPAPTSTTLYERFGIRRVINAELTRLGGSLMPPSVLRTTNDAARSVCDLHDLRQTCGAHVASLN
jgi:L-seryl-tRNA(Ser) seleniumtransferase